MRERVFSGRRSYIVARIRVNVTLAPPKAVEYHTSQQVALQEGTLDEAGYFTTTRRNGAGKNLE